MASLYKQLYWHLELHRSHSYKGLARKFCFLTKCNWIIFNQRYSDYTTLSGCEFFLPCLGRCCRMALTPHPPFTSHQVDEGLRVGSHRLAGVWDTPQQIKLRLEITQIRRYNCQCQDSTLLVLVTHELVSVSRNRKLDIDWIFEHWRCEASATILALRTTSYFTTGID